MEFKTIELKGDFIAGNYRKYKDLDFSHEIRCPANFSDHVTTLEGSYEGIDEIFDVAEKSKWKWYKRGLAERVVLVRKLIQEVEKNKEEFAQTISREIGKPLWESRVEVTDGIDRMRAEIDLTENLQREREVTEERSSVLLDKDEKLFGVRRVKPRGVVAVLGHYNDPMSNPLIYIVPSLLHGNVVVFKPSKRAPATGQLICESIKAMTLDAGIFSMIQGGREMSRRLIQHHSVDTVFYGGEYEFGKQLRKDTFEHSGKLLALETGGKNPAIVWEDADIDTALWEILIGAYITAGQRQESTSRLLLHRKIAENFIIKFHNMAKAFVIGSPFDETKPPFMGPLVDKKTLERYLTFQGIAVRENSKCIMRGKSLSFEHEGYYVSPSIYLFHSNEVEDVKKSVYLQTEIFGPSVGIHIVDEVEEVVELANATNYGLSCSVFSKSEDIFRKMWEGLRYGQIHWNEGTYRKSTHLPTIGIGRSYNASPLIDDLAQHVLYPVTSIETKSNRLNLKKLPPGLERG